MILTAHQPAYLPWLGFFHKLALSDTFCSMDTAAYSRYDFVSRNRIKTAAGALWLSVPVHVAGPARRICDLRIAGCHWQRKHAAALRQSYGKAPYFDDYAVELEALLLRRRKYLCELNADLLRFFIRVLGMKVRLVAASDYHFKGRKSELVLDMCRALGATTFVFGSRGRDYADVGAFRTAGIDLAFQDYRHPVYAQRYGAFIPALSIVDLFFNEGPRSLDVIFRGNERTITASQVGRREPQQNHPLAADLWIKNQ